MERVALTEEAAELIRRLRADHGELMFHQSGGCCDGSAPMCAVTPTSFSSLISAQISGENPA